MEATTFKNGVVVGQVNRIVDTFPRVDVPTDWVTFLVQSTTPSHIEPLFTRDPAQVSEIQVLMARIASKDIDAE